MEGGGKTAGLGKRGGSFKKGQTFLKNLNWKPAEFKSTGARSVGGFADLTKESNQKTQAGGLDVMNARTV